ncbi:MAG: hypothetical protein BRC28_00730 [Nanohaloarchaea archaeon SW_4_43_9]|nr:MAG: hypothetical protein BRC28_00730 [Nanohaloarchaea archaeon SW_4_43_9]
MIAGLMLASKEENKSSLAFIGESSTETFSIKDTGGLIDLILERKPEILAINCGTELNGDNLTKNEEELKEEGYSFTPSNSEKKKVERTRAIERSVKHHMENPPEIIRFDPFISSRELSLNSDDSVESLGVDTSNIGSSHEFDAVVGAITARFYSQNQYTRSGVVVPENV